jgi:alpha-glucosidase
MSKSSWWRNASVYQIYVRSFSDSNGNGIGDLKGIRSRLPYIASLGVDAIWLNPCYPSPQIDHGYDVANYFDIEPDYGDLGEFDALVDAASAHNIRILMDVVPNHCSSEHKWFKAALAAAPGSAERARFYFRPGKGQHGELPPNNWIAIFGGSAWTRVTEADGTPGEWYLGVFTPQQPDMNWENPEVVQHFDDMLRFWFDRGVEGFRADAVTVLAKTPGLPDWDDPEGQANWEPNPHFTWLPKGHDAWRHWREVVDAYNIERDRDVFIVAEAYTPGRPDLMLEYVNPTEFQQAFAFDLMLSPWKPEWIRKAIDETLRTLSDVGELPAWTLNNHDVQRSVTRYGRASCATANELAKGALSNSKESVDLVVGLRRARAAALLEMALPGCVYLYAGEELGLPEWLDMPDSARQDPVFGNTQGREYGRDGCRVPLPWTADGAGNNGFSPSTSTTASWLPQPADWGKYSPEMQEREASSTLAMYRAAGELRRNNPGLQSDDFYWHHIGDDSLLVFSRGETLVLFNATSADVAIGTDVLGVRSILLSSVYDHNDALLVPANATVWLG